MTLLPLDFPPLVEMAERAAIEHHEVGVPVHSWYGSARPQAWAEVSVVLRTRERDVQARLLSDLTRPGPQALWLRWLAEHRNTRNPVVGCPQFVFAYDSWMAMAWARFGAGVFWETFAFGHQYGAIQCPALDNPDSDDAPVRALVLAILTVGGAR